MAVHQSAGLQGGADRRDKAAEAAQNASASVWPHCFSPRPAAKKFLPDPTTNAGSRQPRFWIAQLARLVEAGAIGDAARMIVYDGFCLIPLTFGDDGAGHRRVVRCPAA